MNIGSDGVGKGKEIGGNESKDEQTQLLPYMPKYKLNLRQPNISL